MVKFSPYLWYFSQGKQVIHPNQIKAVQEEFSPSPDRVNWATELITAFEEHQKLGKVHHCITMIFSITIHQPFTYFYFFCTASLSFINLTTFGEQINR